MGSTLFTIDPDPPVAGKTAKLCYDFAGRPAGTSITVTLKWVPNTIPASFVTLTDAEPCKEVLIPLGATEGFAIDGSGWSADLGFFID